MITQHQIASRLTSTPRCAINASTSPMLDVKRKYQRTACAITASGYR